uniref:RNA ligase domain-containing protein n=1 Tax=viral metagenome TaxID=1070528 RepID=A0A6C0AC73_9ZZZZ
MLLFVLYSLNEIFQSIRSYYKKPNVHNYNDKNNKPTPLGTKTEYFHKYSSLTNHYMKKLITGYMHSKPELANQKWCATEKIHGGNFAWLIYLDENYNIKIDYCKRSGVIPEGDKTFTHDKIVEKYKNRIITLAVRLMDDERFEAKTVQIFGEIFGGWYLGETADGHKHLNKKIAYNDKVDFAGFDIRVTGDKFNGYLNKLDTFVLFDLYRIYRVKVLATGTFDELYKNLNPIFKSDVFRDFNMPINEKLYNEKDIYINPYIAEGIVLTPINTTYINGHRVAIKWKNKKFTENDSNYVPKPKNNSDNDKYSYHVKTLGQYINNNRFDAVKSKLSEKQLKNKMAVVGLIVSDAIDDLKNNYEEMDICPSEVLTFLKFENKDIKKIKALACTEYATKIYDWINQC